jgi:hypothetical protein
MITAGMLVGTLFTLFVLPTLYLPFGARAKQRTAAARTDRELASN